MWYLLASRSFERFASNTSFTILGAKPTLERQVVLNGTLLYRNTSFWLTVLSGGTESSVVATKALKMFRTDAVDAHVVAVAIVSLCFTSEPPIVFANHNVARKL
jgi:hypothetical protein